MSLWEKTKELFKRLKGDDTPPPVRPDPTPGAVLPVSFEKLPRWKQDQRDYRARARAVAMWWDSRPKSAGGQGTYRRLGPKPKRPGRARRTFLALTVPT